MWRTLGFAVGAVITAPAHATEADPITLGPVRVQLFYEYSGKLSPDIAPPARFDLWNVGAGEGSAAEPASDALVTVALRMKPSDTAVFTGPPVTLTARNAAGKTIATRTFAKGMILVPTTGVSYARLWLSGVQCAGRVMIEARYGAQTRRAALNFACGE